MRWYFEIADKNNGLLETSKPIYSSKYEAEWAGYLRVKKRPASLIREIPKIGGKVEGELRSVAVIGRSSRPSNKPSSGPNARFKMRVLLLVAAIGFVGTSAAVAQQNKPSQEDAAVLKQLAGAWRLVSWTEHLADGTTRQNRLTVGYLIYSDTNRMCTTIMDPNRPKWKSGTPTPEEAKSTVLGLVAYCAKVEVHAKEGVVLHYVDVAYSPNAIGRVFKRGFTFEGPNRLILRIGATQNAPNVVESTLAWERVEESVN